MSQPQIIKHHNIVKAIIIRKNIKVNKVEFFTPKDYPFQIGFHSRKKNTVLKPHLHPIHNFFITSSQEVLYVLEGKIQVDLYTTKKQLFKKIILRDGDSILFVSGGHGIKFLKQSRVFEVKQGPYVGDELAKIFI